MSRALLVALVVPLLLPSHVRADQSRTGPFTFPAGTVAPDITDLAPPAPIVDAAGHFLVVFRTAAGLQVAEFASDGSLGPATAIPAVVNAVAQPIDVIDTQPASLASLTSRDLRSQKAQRR